MSADIVLFFGAGASKVEPYDYPITTEFFDRALSLDDEVDSRILAEMKNLAGFIWDDHTDHPLNGKDIEELMHVLTGFRSLGGSSFGKGLSGYFKRYVNSILNPRNVSEIVAKHIRSHYDVGTCGGIADSIVSKFGDFESLDEYLSKIAKDIELVLKRWVLKVYGGAKDKGYSKWHRLLITDVVAWEKRYSPECKHIPVFTVNYDQVIEASCEGWQVDPGLEFEDCFKENGAWYQMDLREPDSGKFLIQLYKLHGSIEWYLYRNRVYRMQGELLLEDPDKHGLIYPAFKAIPSYIPYGHHHDMLEKTLEMAIGCIVIGFAFRDDYINRIFEKAMAKQYEGKPDLRLVVVNPDSELMEKPPLLQLRRTYGKERIIHITTTFGKDSDQPTRDALVEILKQGEMHRKKLKAG